MNKKIIFVAVAILAISMLFVACNKDEEEQPAPSTEAAAPEVSTNVDEKGAYVFNKDGEKVYLVDEQGFNISPEDAYNMPAQKEDGEGGFYVGGATDGEKVPNINWSEIN